MVTFGGGKKEVVIDRTSDNVDNVVFLKLMVFARTDLLCDHSLSHMLKFCDFSI